MDDDTDMMEEQSNNSVQTSTHDGISHQNFTDSYKILFGNFANWFKFYMENIKHD